MTYGALVPSPWLRHSPWPQNLECTLKIKTAGLWKKCFHKLFHFMITNEVPVNILQAYFSLQRHIRKGILIRWIITSDFCTAVGCQQFHKESRKLQRRIVFERNYFFYHHCCCLAVIRNVSKTVIWVNQNGGVQAVVREDTAPPAPLPPPP